MVYKIDLKDNKVVNTGVYQFSHPYILDFIGEFDRFRIHIAKVQKAADFTYSVCGRWCWYGDEGDVRDSKGAIYLDSIKLLPPMRDYEVEFNSTIHRTEQGMIYATVELIDNNRNGWKGKGIYIRCD